ncbi:hypothetical protein GUJ93_ZPchr0002g25481 [Zizania palustris]|uniref:Uncharacterized protein n=1 Tax=Zizania palustris TaxID=103762 RepID=A0A8J5RZB7_ZIZPA|nr:hypothetical protein GUJ93_ZPchr0002g25481 [Zizania palustris]
MQPRGTARSDIWTKERRYATRGGKREPPRAGAHPPEFAVITAVSIPSPPPLSPGAAVSDHREAGGGRRSGGRRGGWPFSAVRSRDEP